MAKLPKYIAIAFGVVIIALLYVLAFVPAPQKKGPSTLVENYAASPDGHMKITSPALNGTVVSPVVAGGSVTGGGWFFKGTFPIRVVDADGTVLGVGQAVAAQGDWASTGTVLWSGIVTFKDPHSATGTILFSKDGPSGLPQNDGSFGLPIRFR
jgi:hypothetical protein